MADRPTKCGFDDQLTNDALQRIAEIAEAKLVNGNLSKFSNGSTALHLKAHGPGRSSGLMGPLYLTERQQVRQFGRRVLPPWGQRGMADINTPIVEQDLKSFLISHEPLPTPETWLSRAAASLRQAFA